MEAVNGITPLEFPDYDGGVAKIDSVCCSGASVSYFWRGSARGRHVEQTVFSAKQALKDSGAELNPIQEADFEAQIEDRLSLAQDGELIPVDHVKTIRRKPAIEMFEIRWTDVSVNRRDRVSGLVAQEIAHVRLYYIEEGFNWVVGVHIHEKVIIEEDEQATLDLQDVEIDEAIHFVEDHRDGWWGVEELQASET